VKKKMRVVLPCRTFFLSVGSVGNAIESLRVKHREFESNKTVEYRSNLFRELIWSEIWSFHGGEDSSRGLLFCNAL
jgi:hypothetical protein